MRKMKRMGRRSFALLLALLLCFNTLTVAAEESVMDPETVATSEESSEAETEAELDADEGADADTELDTDEDADTDTEVDTDEDADADTELDADEDADLDTEADTDEDAEEPEVKEAVTKEIPAEVQEFLDAAAQIPKEITAENVEEAGELVNAAIDAYEVLYDVAEGAYLEREDVQNAYAEVEAAYMTVQDVWENESGVGDAETYGLVSGDYGGFVYSPRGEFTATDGTPICVQKWDFDNPKHPYEYYNYLRYWYEKNSTQYAQYAQYLPYAEKGDSSCFERCQNFIDRGSFMPQVLQTRTVEAGKTAVFGYLVTTTDHQMNMGSQVPSVYLYDVVDVTQGEEYIDGGREAIRFYASKDKGLQGLWPYVSPNNPHIRMDTPIAADAPDGSTIQIRFRLAYGFEAAWWGNPNGYSQSTGKGDPHRENNYYWYVEDFVYTLKVGNGGTTPEPEANVKKYHDLYIPAGYSAEMNFVEYYYDDWRGSVCCVLSDNDYQQGDSSVAEITKSVLSRNTPRGSKIYNDVIIASAADAKVGDTTKLYATYKATVPSGWGSGSWTCLDVITVHIIEPRKVQLEVGGKETVRTLGKSDDGVLSTNGTIFRFNQGDTSIVKGQNDMSVQTMTLTGISEGTAVIERQYHYYLNTNGDDYLSTYVDVVNVTVGNPASDDPDSIDGLDIKKEVNMTEAMGGEELIYTITVTNDSSVDKKVTVTDMLPNGTTYQSHETENGTATLGSDGYTLTWEPTVPSKGSAVLNVKVKLDDNARGNVTNEAVLTSGNGDTDNATVTTTVTLKQTAPNLTITKTVDKTNVKKDENVTYTITVKNTGDADATDVKVVDPLNAEWLEFVSYQIGSGEVVATEPDESEYSIGTVAKANGSVELKITAKAKKAGEIPANTAYLNPKDPSEPGKENGGSTSSNPVNVADPKGISLVKKVDGEDSKELTAETRGSELTYVITVTNNTNVALKDMLIRDKMPEGLTLVENSGSVTVNGETRTFSVTETGDYHDWRVDGVVADETVVILTYKAKVAGNDALENAKNIAKAFAKSAVTTANGTGNVSGTATIVLMSENVFSGNSNIDTPDGYGDEFESNEDDATLTVPEHNHDWEEKKEAGKEPDCIHDGIAVYECSCGGTKNVKTDSKLGHDFTNATAVDNCNDHKDESCDGHTLTCTRCKGTLIDGNETKTEIHSYPDDWTTVTAATCTIPAVETKTCTACGHVITNGNPTAALGHDMQEISGTAKEPTCTEAGKETDKKCSHCDHTETGAEIKATGHDFTDVEWLDNNESGRHTDDCTSTQHRQICKKCSGKEDGGINYADHTYGEWTVTKEPTAGERGEREHTCTVCGHVEKEEIAALGEVTITIEYRDGDIVVKKETVIVTKDEEYDVTDMIKIPENYEANGEPENVTGKADSDKTVIVPVKKREYTVTYTDGVEGEEIFADQVTDKLKAGENTPAFDGTPTRDGYTFAGWDPEVAEKVNGNAIYVAQWTPNTTPGTTPTPGPGPAPTPDDPTPDDPTPDDPTPDDPTPVVPAPVVPAPVVPVVPAVTPVAPTVVPPAAPAEEPEVEIEENQPPLAAPERQPEEEVVIPAAQVEIEDEELPLAAGNGRSWALVNFALMNLAVFETLMLLIGYFVNTRKEEEEEEGKKLKKKGIVRLVSLPVAIISIIVFCLTEDITLPTGFVDRWTIWMAVIAVAQTVLAAFSRKKEEEEPEKVRA